MENGLTLYIVRMERYGDPELHSYNLGIYDTPSLAEAAGQEEHQSRAGKYEYLVEPFVVNDTDYISHGYINFTIFGVEMNLYKFKRKKERYINIYYHKKRHNKEKMMLIGLHWFSLSFSWGRSEIR